jgi:hypothetical protein
MSLPDWEGEDITFEHQTVIFASETYTSEAADIQTIALLAQILLNPYFMRELAAGKGRLIATFDISKCLETNVLQLLNSMYEKKSQVEVS